LPVKKTGLVTWKVHVKNCWPSVSIYIYGIGPQTLKPNVTNNIDNQLDATVTVY